jgi:hypothetical protein
MAGRSSLAASLETNPEPTQLKFLCLHCKYIGPTNVVGVTTGRPLCPECETPMIPGDGICRRAVLRPSPLTA